MFMRSYVIFLIFVSCLFLASCKDECQEYSDFTCDQIEQAEYNVYFYFPNGNEYYIGETKGLESCGNMAWGYASEKNLSNNSDWSYICCMIAKGSDCYEKHR